MAARLSASKDGPEQVQEEFQLFETMLHTHEQGFFLLDGHLRRLQRSAGALGFVCPPREALLRRLDEEALAWSRTSASRVRLLLERSGGLRVERAEQPGVSRHPPVSMLGGSGPARRLRLDAEATPSSSVWFAHKTTRRDAYDAARRRAEVSNEPGNSSPLSYAGSRERRA